MLEAAFLITGRGWVLAVKVRQWLGELRVGDGLSIMRPGTSPEACRIAGYPQSPRRFPPELEPSLAFLIRDWTPDTSPQEWVGATVSLVSDPLPGLTPCYPFPMNDDARPAPEERDTIDLQDFLKLRGLVETGGEAKFRVQGGEVRLNGAIETRRRKKLRRGDIVEYAGERVRVDW